MIIEFTLPPSDAEDGFFSPHPGGVQLRAPGLTARRAPFVLPESACALAHRG